MSENLTSAIAVWGARGRGYGRGRSGKSIPESTEAQKQQKRGAAKRVHMLADVPQHVKDN